MSLSWNYTCRVLLLLLALLNWIFIVWKMWAGAKFINANNILVNGKRGETHPPQHPFWQSLWWEAAELPRSLWASHLMLRISPAWVFGNICRIDSGRFQFTPPSCYIRGNVWSWMGFLSINISTLVLAIKTYYLDSMFSASFGFGMFELSLKYYFVIRKQGRLKTTQAMTVLKRFSIVF